MDKRGQGLSTNAIILIVLGVVVLVVLIVGFTMGWNRIAPWLSSDNVDTIVQQCGVACSTNANYDFCSVERELKAEGTKIKTTCKIFSTEFTEYGVETCNLQCEDIKNCVDIKIVVDGVGKEGVLGTLACESITHYDVTAMAKDVDATNTACCIAK